MLKYAQQLISLIDDTLCLRGPLQQWLEDKWNHLMACNMPVAESHAFVKCVAKHHNIAEDKPYVQAFVNDVNILAYDDTECIGDHL